MIRSEEQLAIRDRVCREVEEAFRRARVGTRYQRSPWDQYCYVTAYLNYGYRGQRQAIVAVADDGSCRAHVSELYDVPEGMTGSDVQLPMLPTLASLPADTPNIADAIVKAIKNATFDL